MKRMFGAIFIFLFTGIMVLRCSCSPSLTISNYMGNVSVSYTNKSNFDTEDLLYTLKKWEYGIFLTAAVTDGTYYTENNCSVDISEFCDAKFSDGIRFGFIREDNGKNARFSSAYSPLEARDWDGVAQYVKDQTSSNGL